MLRPIRQLLVCLLAVLLTASFSMSAVRAAEMTMEMSASPAMMSVGHGDMNGCGGADVCKVKASNCVAVCAASVIATFPQPRPADVVEIVTIIAIPEDEFFSGAKPPPERYPPKTN
jgi:hypothetical protein